MPIIALTPIVVLPCQHLAPCLPTGVGQNAQGACSYGSNGANSLNLTWTQGNQNTVALNDQQFNASNTCGMCIKYRGLGTGALLLVLTPQGDGQPA